MEKSIHTLEYESLLKLLRETRTAAGVTQTQLAERIGQSQSFVSKMEVGERRLDVIQLRTVCRELGTTLPSFIAALESCLTATSPPNRGKGRKRS